MPCAFPSNDIVFHFGKIPALVVGKSNKEKILLSMVRCHPARVNGERGGGEKHGRTDNVIPSRVEKVNPVKVRDMLSGSHVKNVRVDKDESKFKDVFGDETGFSPGTSNIRYLTITSRAPGD